MKVNESFCRIPASPLQDIAAYTYLTKVRTKKEQINRTESFLDSTNLLLVFVLMFVQKFVLLFLSYFL